MRAKWGRWFFWGCVASGFILMLWTIVLGGFFYRGPLLPTLYWNPATLGWSFGNRWGLESWTVSIVGGIVLAAWVLWALTVTGIIGVIAMDGIHRLMKRLFSGSG